MRDFLQWRCRDAIMLTEANVPPDESLQYFGDLGDRVQMMLNFPVNQRVFYALATGDIKPLVKALEETYRRPHAAQWVNFLRSHDELDLGRLTDAERERVFEAFGPAPNMQLYNRGIRRRLAPMFDNDRRRIELAFSLALHAPGHADAAIRRRDRHGRRSHAAGARVLAHADAMVGRCERRLFDREANSAAGDQRSDLWLSARQRRGAAPGSGFNVELDGTRDPHAQGMPGNQLGRLAHLEDAGAREVLAMRYDWDEHTLIALHNFSPKPRAVRLDALCWAIGRSSICCPWRIAMADESGRHQIQLDAYGYRWYRAGGLDRNVARS